MERGPSEPELTPNYCRNPEPPGAPRAGVRMFVAGLLLLLATQPVGPLQRFVPVDPSLILMGYICGSLLAMAGAILSVHDCW